MYDALSSPQSALFNFQSLILVFLLLVCTCTYIRSVAPGIVDRNREGYVRRSSSPTHRLTGLKLG